MRTVAPSAHGAASPRQAAVGTRAAWSDRSRTSPSHRVGRDVVARPGTGALCRDRNDPSPERVCDVKPNGCFSKYTRLTHRSRILHPFNQRPDSARSDQATTDSAGAVTRSIGRMIKKLDAGQWKVCRDSLADPEPARRRAPRIADDQGAMSALLSPVRGGPRSYRAAVARVALSRSGQERGTTPWAR